MNMSRNCWNCRFCDRYQGQSICTLKNMIVDVNDEGCCDWILHPSIVSQLSHQ